MIKNRISKYYGSSGFDKDLATCIAARIEAAIMAHIKRMGESIDSPSRRTLASITVGIDMAMNSHQAGCLASEGYPDDLVEEALRRNADASRSLTTDIILDLINENYFN